MNSQLQLWSEHLPAWLWNIGVIIFSLLLGYIIKLIITAILHFYKNRNDYSLFKSIITHLEKPLNYFVPLLTLNFMIPLTQLSSTAKLLLNRVSGIAMVIAFAYLLTSSINILEDYVFHLYNLNKANNLKERKIRTQMIFIRKVIVVTIILVSIAIILLSFNNVRKIGAGLLTGVGIGGIVVGFAAQKSLANLLAGFQIAFTQPIRIDDVLVVEGEWGKVEDITLTYVVLSIWDERRLILPINYFIEKPFQNWTRTTSELLGTVFLYVDYTFPVEGLRAELNRLLDGNKLWDKRVGIIQVTDVREHTIEVRILVSSGNSSDAFDLRCFIREKMLKYIAENMPQNLPLTRYAPIGGVALPGQDAQTPETKEATSTPPQTS